MPRHDSGSINEPEVSLKNLDKDNKPVKSEAIEDDLDDNSFSDSSNPTNNRSSFDDKSASAGGNSSPSLNPGSFLSMAAASLIDPSAAKGTILKKMRSDEENKYVAITKSGNSMKMPAK